MVFWLCDWTRRPRDFSARCGGFTRRTPNAVASCSRALAPITPATFRVLTTRTEVIEAEQGQPRIGAGQTVRDVLMRYPSTGPIFLQHGAMFTVKPGELYLRYDELTLEKYAALNRIALEPLLRLLNTAAEHEDRPP